MKFLNTIFISILLISCQEKMPVIEPDVKTAQVTHDPDDPAIWVNKENPGESIIFGTDKDTDGAIYAFDLEGKVIESKTMRNLKRPNNIDIEYDVELNDSTTTDIMIFTEREQEQIRIFSIPDLKPLDQGGIKVFQDTRENEMSLPMGISIYKSPKSGKTYAVVGRKNGPEDGYLHQLELEPAGDYLNPKLVREFGKFSGKKEIEAITVDDELGFIYYSDEMHCVRKYYAEPEMGDEELACFGEEDFKRDIEGVTVTMYPGGEKGQVIVSDQQNHTFNFYSRKDNSFEYSLNLGTTETDGCAATTQALGDKFPNGLLVTMNDGGRNFFYHDLARLKPASKE